MFKKFFKLLSFLTILLIISGCSARSYNKDNGYNTSLNIAITKMADDLLEHNRLDSEDMGSIAITSFVDLHQLDKTTHMGRLISESFFSELFTRGFEVVDFRGRNAISVNKSGEFFVTRDTSKMASSINHKYILIGTYSEFKQNTHINARIIDTTTGKIVSSSRFIYTKSDCSLYEDCEDGINPEGRVKIISGD